MKINRQNKRIVRYKKFSTFFLAIFLIYLTAFPYLSSANERVLYNIFITSIILIIVYYWVLSQLFEYYNTWIKFVILRFKKVKSKFANEIIIFSWLPSSIVLGLSSIILFIIFVHYILLETSILGNLNDYRLIAVNINSIYLPLIVILGLLIVWVLQAILLVKKGKIPWLYSIVFSFVTIIMFSLINIVIIIIINTVLNMI